MPLVGDSGINSPDPEESWWKREKKRLKERTVSLGIMIPEVTLYAWIVLGVLDLGLSTLLVAYCSGYLVPFLGFPAYRFEKEEPLPRWLESLAQQLDMMDWFVFEFQAFTTRILLVVFVVSCVAALVFVGVGEKLAVVTALALIALSLPTYLVYYVVGQNEGEDWTGT